MDEKIGCICVLCWFVIGEWKLLHGRIWPYVVCSLSFNSPIFIGIVYILIIIKNHNFPGAITGQNKNTGPLHSACFIQAVPFSEYDFKIKYDYLLDTLVLHRGCCTFLDYTGFRVAWLLWWPKRTIMLRILQLL